MTIIGMLKKRRSWLYTKEDFLPDESFQSWSNYVNALKKIPHRFADRLVSRSKEEVEEVNLRREYENRKQITKWDLLFLGVGAIVGAGIFVLTGVQVKVQVGPAVILSYLIASVSSILSVLCYTEFVVEIPIAGGLFAYIRTELGDLMAFITACNILLKSILGGAAVARSWTSYLATLCDHDPDTFRITAPKLGLNYNLLDPISVVILAVICILSITTTRISSRLNFILTIAHMVLFLFIIFAGFSKAEMANYEPFTPYELSGIFQGSAILIFAFVGFEVVSIMAEETENPSKDIPFGLIGSVLVAAMLYCVLAAMLCVMQRYQLVDLNAPFSKAFSRVGLGWVKYFVDIAALKGMTTVLLINTMGQARYLTHVARTHMLPPWFGEVSSILRTPANATIFMLTITAIVALFTDVTILSSLLSISALVTFILVAVALLVRRYDYNVEQTTYGNRIKLIICITVILSSSIATSICWNFSYDSSWIGYVVTTSVWLLSTFGLRILVPQGRRPKCWGVPFMPWLPSASIFINTFLLGCIDKDSFVRFGLWLMILMIYYLLVGLHASYDFAKFMDRSSIPNIQSLGSIEEGS